MCASGGRTKSPTTRPCRDTLNGDILRLDPTSVADLPFDGALVSLADRGDLCVPHAASMDRHPLTCEARVRSARPLQIGPLHIRSAAHFDSDGGKEIRNSARPGWTARPGFGAALPSDGRTVRSAAQEKGSDARTEQRMGRTVQNRVKRTLVVDGASRPARPDRRDARRRTSDLRAAELRALLDPRNGIGPGAGRSRAPDCGRGRSRGRGG